MTRAVLLGVLAVGVGVGTRARGDEKEARVVIDRAIQALGGEEKLARVKAFSEKGKGTIVLGEDDLDFTFAMTAQGIRKHRSEYEGEFNGTKFAGVTVLDEDKAWKKRDDDVTRLEAEKLAIEKRTAYLDVIPVLVLPLKGEGFKLDSAPDEKVDDKPAAVVRVTAPDGKDFTLAFDKASGLPVRLVAVVPDEEGQEDSQEQTFEDYKDFGGIQVATRSRIKRGGKRFIEMEGIEFKALDEVEPATFAEPK